MVRFAFIPLLCAATMVSATEYSVNGSLTAEVGTNLDASWTPHNTVNQDLNFTFRADFDEKASVDVYFTNSSFITDSAGNSRVSVVRSVEEGRSAMISDSDSRWGTLAFDRILFQWEFTRMVKLLVGDYTWAAGTSNYYGYSWAQEYGSITKENTLRGLGVQMGEDGQVFVGAPDANDKAIWAYASYRFLLTDKTNETWAVRPVGDLVLKNGGRHRNFTFGAETEYLKTTESLEYGFSGAYGAIPYHGKTTHTFLAEPSMTFKQFSLGGTFYTAILAQKDSAVLNQTDIPSQMFAYVEPSFSVFSKFAIGLGAEWHNPSIEVSEDETYAIVPTFYLYPSQQMSFTLWTKYQWVLNAGDLFSTGLTANVEF